MAVADEVVGSVAIAAETVEEVVVIGTGVVVAAVAGRRDVADEVVGSGAEAARVVREGRVVVKGGWT